MDVDLYIDSSFMSIVNDLYSGEVGRFSYRVIRFSYVTALSSTPSMLRMSNVGMKSFAFLKGTQIL